MPSPIIVQRGEIVFTQDLNGVTTSTTYPSASTDGVGVPTDAINRATGDRVHVLLRYQVASGTLSTDVHVYAYMTTPGHWAHIGSLNGGYSIGTDTKWSANASTICLMEQFGLPLGNVERVATRCISPQGTTPLVSTWVGYERA